MIIFREGKVKFYSVGHIVFWVVWGMVFGFVAAILVFKVL